MKEKNILRKVNNLIDQAPIDILDNIKKQPRAKMLKHDDITRQRVGDKRFKKLIPYTAVAVIFLVAFLNLQIQTRLVEDSIYLDVNPSINFTTNRKEEVIKLQADNFEGKEIIAGLEFEGRTIEQMTQVLLNKMIEENYITEEDNYLLLSVYNKNSKKMDKQKENLDKIIYEYMKQKKIEPIILTQDIDKTDKMEKLAEKYKISINKMTFISNIIELEPKLKEKDLVKLSISELVELVLENNLNLEKIIKTRDMDKIKREDKKKIEVDETEEIDDDNIDTEVKMDSQEIKNKEDKEDSKEDSKEKIKKPNEKPNEKSNEEPINEIIQKPTNEPIKKPKSEEKDDSDDKNDKKDDEKDKEDEDKDKKDDDNDDDDDDDDNDD